MTKIATPRTTEAATALLARHAEIDAAIAAAEADRQSQIASVNAAADAVIEPMVADRAKLQGALAPWWARVAPDLTGGKRKSIELGGCRIGTRTSAEKVEFSDGDDKAALAALADSPARASATEIKRVLDKKAIAAALKGKAKIRATLEALGFRLAGGEDTFFVSRVDSADAKVSAR